LASSNKRAQWTADDQRATLVLLGKLHLGGEPRVRRELAGVEVS
jgi:hypothetical protein